MYISQSYKSYHILYIIFYIQYTLTFTVCILVSLLKCLFISWHQVFSKTKKSSLKCPSFYWLTNHVIFICTCNRPKTALTTRLFHPSYHEAWVDFSLVKKPENDRFCLSAARGRSLAAPENRGEIWTPRNKLQGKSRHQNYWPLEPRFHLTLQKW